MIKFILALPQRIGAYLYQVIHLLLWAVQWVLFISVAIIVVLLVVVFGAILFSPLLLNRFFAFWLLGCRGRDWRNGDLYIILNKRMGR